MSCVPGTSTITYDFDDSNVEEYNYFEMDDDDETPEPKMDNFEEYDGYERVEEPQEEVFEEEDEFVKFWRTEPTPASVFDQAVEEQDRCPTDDILYLGRIFGEPSRRIEPCRSCCGMQYESDYTNNNTAAKKKGKARRKLAYPKPRGFNGWSQEAYVNSTDSCPAHYVNFVLEDRAKEYQKIVDAEEKERKKREDRERAAANRKGKKGAKRKYVSDDDDDYDDDYDADYRFPGYYAPPKPKKKRTVWMCPYCNKSSKFGSCGCSQCDEWFHLTCVGFRSCKEVPDKWVCNICLTNFH